MASTRQSTVNEAAGYLGVKEEIIEQMVTAGQIMVDSYKPSFLVLIRDDPKANPRYTPIPPPIKQICEAVSVKLSGTVPDEVAAQAFKVLSEIGFLVGAGPRDTHITPTDLLKVDTVPQIQDRLDADCGKNKVKAFITTYNRRGSGPCPLDPIPHG